MNIDEADMYLHIKALTELCRSQAEQIASLTRQVEVLSLCGELEEPKNDVVEKTTARDYLLDRGIPKGAVSAFDLGSMALDVYRHQDPGVTPERTNTGQYLYPVVILDEAFKRVQGSGPFRSVD